MFTIHIVCISDRFFKIGFIHVVIGFANTSVTANGTVKVIIAGAIDLTGLDAGDLYFLSPTTAGAITLTPPSAAGQAVTRVGEAATATKFATHIEPPIKLS